MAWLSGGLWLISQVEDGGMLMGRGDGKTSGEREGWEQGTGWPRGESTSGSGNLAIHLGTR